MKNTSIPGSRVAASIKLPTILLAVCLLALAGSRGYAASLDPAFTYSGRLTYQGNPANGSFDLQASLYDDPINSNNKIGPTINADNVNVVAGLFVTNFNFGSVFNGTAYWLEIAIRPSGGNGYQLLSPRQPLNPAPYALYAPLAGTANTAITAGAVAANSISAASIAAGQVVKSLNGLKDNVSLQPGNNVTLTANGNTLTIASSGASSGWSLAGNAGTTAGQNFVGTTDNQPLELKTDNQRALRLEDASDGQGGYAVNVVGGAAVNRISGGAIAATIAGGGDYYRDPNNPILNFDFPNEVSGNYGTISGGFGNRVSAWGGSIAGGSGNQVGGSFGFAAGGSGNIANGQNSLAAGRDAQANDDRSFVWSDGTHPSAASSGPYTFSIFAQGGLRLSYATSLFCGSQTRQMLNLWGTSYGIGVQAAMQYCRSDGDFAWYQHGIHSDTYGDPGAGGATLMRLNDHFLTVTGAGNEQAYIGGDGLGNDVQLGSRNPAISDVYLWNTANGLMDLHARNTTVCTLTITGGCDLAEPFQVSENEIPKGSVVSIDADHPGQVKLSTQPYDTSVAGIISGAGGVQPGIQMNQKGTLEGTENVALTGRVYVLADATQGAIVPGDLLTTSATPGHAMKVSDHTRAQGAILGKAMGALKEGRGMVLVLVTLQ